MLRRRFHKNILLTLCPTKVNDRVRVPLVYIQCLMTEYRMKFILRTIINVSSFIREIRTTPTPTTSPPTTPTTTPPPLSEVCGLTNPGVSLSAGTCDFEQGECGYRSEGVEGSKLTWKRQGGVYGSYLYSSQIHGDHGTGNGKNEFSLPYSTGECIKAHSPSIIMDRRVRGRDGSIFGGYRFIALLDVIVNYHPQYIFRCVLTF